MMKFRHLAMLAGTCLMMAFSAAAEEAPAEAATEAPAAEAVQAAAPQTITTEDGVLSIQLPSDGWQQMVDPKYWVTLTNGTDIITIDHLSNGESLPSPEVAGENFGAVCQTYVSTRNEVFVVKGCAANPSSLVGIMQSVGTIRILKYDTKTAIQKETSAPVSSFGLREFNATLYVAADELNVRTGCSSDEAILGVLYRGEAVNVLGAVTKDGSDYGWYQISYNGAQAYVSAGFLSESEVAPAVSDSEQPGYVYCEYCGKWYEEGNVFRNHICPARDAALNPEAAAPEMVLCEYCGQYYEAGNVFRNHICPARDAALNPEMVLCEYCGQYYAAGNEFRNHICPARDAALNPDASSNQSDQEMVLCEYCGQYFAAGNEFRNHICPARDAAMAEGN